MCGVIGVIGPKQAAKQVLLGLTLLQHRGQDAAGILTHDEHGFHFVKNQGLVEQVFTPENVTALTGPMALGHVRYSTTGRSELSSVQPFVANYPYGLGMVHNGNLVNFARLSRELKEDSRRHPLTQSDTEVILNLFSDALSRVPKKDQLSFHSICMATQEVFARAVGSYSIITMIAGYGLVAFRDPNGIRPLVWGQKKESDGTRSHIFSSESTVSSFLGYEGIKDVAPGSIVAITLDGEVHQAQIQKPDSRPCMFEWVYFASPQAEIEGSTVYNARIHLGRNLAKKVALEIAAKRIQPDLIVPVPETARIAAIALSEELGIPYREVLIKNRYISRTFILDTQDKREKAVQLKLAPVESELRGKRVLLVDDSIVRGTTSKKLIELVRQCGAKEVYFVSTAPAISHACFYGIDFPRQGELIAYDKELSEIETALGADRVIYQDEQALLFAIQPANPQLRESSPISPCMACLNGDYPTSISESEEMIGRRAGA
jgi:amidophosphoribosyltransferase